MKMAAKGNRKSDKDYYPITECSSESKEDNKQVDSAMTVMSWKEVKQHLNIPFDLLLSKMPTNADTWQGGRAKHNI